MDKSEIPDAFYDLALECSNQELMRRLDVDRETVRAWRRMTGLHRPRGVQTLPPSSQVNTTMTLSELAKDHGWKSLCRFSEVLRKYRPAIHAAAKANGRRRSNVHLKSAKYANRV